LRTPKHFLRNSQGLLEKFQELLKESTGGSQGVLKEFSRSSQVVNEGLKEFSRMCEGV